MPRDDYQERQEARRGRLENRAAAQDSESSRRCNAARTMAGVMQGEPIKIGHHSEKRHRRDIRRMDDNMRKSCELAKKAEHNRDAAAGVGCAGISSDDPEALVKLREEIAGHEERREALKRLNAAWRKAKRPQPDDNDGWQRVADILVCDIGQLSGGRRNMVACWSGKPVSPYTLTNLGANIKRLKDRLTRLETEFAAQRQAEEAGEDDRVYAAGENWRAIERFDLNRLHLVLDDRIDRDDFKWIKSTGGFRWSRTEQAFSRLLNNNARGTVDYLVNTDRFKTIMKGDS